MALDHVAVLIMLHELTLQLSSLTDGFLDSSELKDGFKSFI